MLQLTNKERTLLQDLQSHEEICIQKYNNYANQAKDPQLKQIFQNLAQKEQNHYNTISQILQGQVPNMQTQQSQQSTGQTTPMYSNQNNPMGSSMSNETEESLCNDMLMTEKYVSSAYNTSIFEMTNAQVRQALQHIQQEEQQHGEELFNYMKTHGMYNVT
jgi:spore coat protein CotF